MNHKLHIVIRLTALVPLAMPAQHTTPVAAGGPVVVTAYGPAGDLGQQFAAAYAAKGQTSYYIPAGTYTTSHTITITLESSGSLSLYCAPGTTIQYNGSGDAFAVLGHGQSQANLVVSGCRFSWTGTTGSANGIRLEAFNKAMLIDVRADGFRNGDGFLNQGVNTVDFYSVQSTDNRNGVHNVGVAVSGVNYAANALHFTGGIIGNNSQWGVYEDAAFAATAGPNTNNTYRDIAFEMNGEPAAAAPSGGQIFIQDCLGCGVQDSYFEFAPRDNSTMACQIALGDDHHSPSMTVIRDNFFASNGERITSAIDAVNSNHGLIEGNLDEDAPETNFVNNGSLSQWTFIGFNFSSASHWVTGKGLLSPSLSANGIAVAPAVKPPATSVPPDSPFASTSNNAVYRCTTAGALPVGALTINRGNCASSADTGMRVR